GTVFGADVPLRLLLVSLGGGGEGDEGDEQAEEQVANGPRERDLRHGGGGVMRVVPRNPHRADGRNHRTWTPPAPASRRGDVAVRAEEVVGIVLPLDRAAAVEVGP